MVHRSSIAGPVFGLRREIDRLFEDTFGRESGRTGWAPAVDVREDAKEIVFEVELPGIKPEDVEVTAENGVLTIRGEKHNVTQEGTEGRYHVVERTYGTFVRSFQLPPNIDDDRIEADFENGLLYVRVPKAALPQPRRIEIRNSGSQPVIGGLGSRGRQSASGQQQADSPTRGAQGMQGGPGMSAQGGSGASAPGAASVQASRGGSEPVQGEPTRGASGGTSRGAAGAGGASGAASGGGTRSSGGSAGTSGRSNTRSSR